MESSVISYSNIKVIKTSTLERLDINKIMCRDCTFCKGFSFWEFKLKILRFVFKLKIWAWSISTITCFWFAKVFFKKIWNTKFFSLQQKRFILASIIFATTVFTETQNDFITDTFICKALILSFYTLATKSNDLL